MPLYEYECESCHHRFERIQKYSDPLVDVCPVCGSKVHKLVSSPAFQFKGTGWYVTDYAKKSGSDSGGGKGSSSASSTGGSSSDASKADGSKSDASSPSTASTTSSSSSSSTTSDSGKKD
jgi:putative FmdB family regulatory protein